MAQTLSTDFYLIARKSTRGYKDIKVRVTEREPSLDVGEIAVFVSLSLPAALFSRPMLRARVIVPADGVEPATINAEVAAGVVDAVRAATGLDMRLTIEAATSSTTTRDGEEPNTASPQVAP